MARQPRRKAGWLTLACCAASASSAAAPAPVAALTPATTPHHTVALCAPDDEIIDAHLGPNATTRVMRGQLGRLGAPPAKLDASRVVLSRDLAAAIRALASIAHGTKLSNVTSLRAGLELKGEPFAEADEAPALLERLEQRLEKECFVVNPRRPLAMSLALEDLQSAAAERMLTSSGNRLELLDRLYHFQQRCDRMVDLIPGFACTLGRVEDALGARGLSKLGSKEELMARLTESVDAGKAAAAAAGDMCDLLTQGPICVENGRKVLTSDAAPKSLLAHFTFDDSRGIDTSGRHNHATRAPSFGPGVGGHGHAARYVGTDYTEVRHDAAYAEAGSAFSVEMWVYLRQDSTGDWRTVVHKGGRDEERTPTLFLEPLTRGLEFFVSTTDAAQPMGERLWSNSFVPMHRWTHVAAVAEGHSLRLYLNGLLDSENVTVGTIVHNNGPFFLGGDPWRPSGGFDGFIDEFKFYGRALTTDEVQAAASFALGGVEPAYIELGCMGCAADAAAATCAINYHLCNTHDLCAVPPLSPVFNARPSAPACPPWPFARMPHALVPLSRWRAGMREGTAWRARWAGRLRTHMCGQRRRRCRWATTTARRGAARLRAPSRRASGCAVATMSRENRFCSLRRETRARRLRGGGGHTLVHCGTENER